MKKNNKLIVSIIAVALIIILVGGGTYAYWMWVSAEDTSISFTVAGGTMTIDGGGDITTTALLAPAACTNEKYAIQRKIVVNAENVTNDSMVEVIQLQVKSLSTTTGTLNETNKASIEWALVRSDTTQHTANTWLEATNNCSLSATSATDETSLNITGTMLAKGNFSNISEGDTITLYDKEIVPSATDNVAGTATDYYELYIWINPNYIGDATVGTTVKDALQDLKITLEWSGTMTNNPNLVG